MNYIPSCTICTVFDECSVLVSWLRSPLQISTADHLSQWGACITSAYHATVHLREAALDLQSSSQSVVCLSQQQTRDCTGRRCCLPT